jgi:hypothetical protein
VKKRHRRQQLHASGKIERRVRTQANQQAGKDQRTDHTDHRACSLAHAEMAAAMFFLA